MAQRLDDLHISSTRLWAALEEYAGYGATVAGGVSRPVFSPADMEMRGRFIADCRALGLPMRVDAAANVFCTRPGAGPALPCILIGSHLDSVPDGGRYDGALGVVSGVCGIYRQHIVFRGEAGHAGTTAMEGRRDALRAAARLILSVPGLPHVAAAADPSATATVGFVEVRPNSPNVIPGEVALVTDLRSADADLLAALAREAEAVARRAASDEGTEVEVRMMLDQAPVHFDPQLRALMAGVVTELGGDGHELASQAGHDAVHLQSLAPSAMLFVRCANGVSHRADESVTPEDAALADPGEPLDLISPERAARRHPALHRLRGYLCPALDRVSGDAFEIARVITPLLAGLKLAGTAPIDLDPWLFAGIALLIARGGVAAFCGEVDDEGTRDVAESATAAADVPHLAAHEEARAVAHATGPHAPDGHDQGQRHGRKRSKR